MEKKIPFATRERYPEYLRALRYFQNKGMEKIMSNDLARELGINSTSVRRDISYLGHMGRQGYGYNIKKVEVIEDENKNDNENKENEKEEEKDEEIKDEEVKDDEFVKEE